MKIHPPNPEPISHNDLIGKVAQFDKEVNKWTTDEAINLIQQVLQEEVLTKETVNSSSSSSSLSILYATAAFACGENRRHVAAIVDEVIKNKTSAQALKQAILLLARTGRGIKKEYIVQNKHQQTIVIPYATNNFNNYSVEAAKERGNRVQKAALLLGASKNNDSTFFPALFPAKEGWWRLRKHPIAKTKVYLQISHPDSSSGKKLSEEEFQKLCGVDKFQSSLIGIRVPYETIFDSGQSQIELLDLRWITLLEDDRQELEDAEQGQKPLLSSMQSFGFSLFHKEEITYAHVGKWIDYTKNIKSRELEVIYNWREQEKEKD